ncbi:MAG: SPOR domain-containing protein [Bacilli bacterium]|nr:SPOR domain-containing protein [Bacilli bacterium]
MKRFLITILFTTLVSILYGNIIFNVYKKNATNILEVMQSEEQVYAVLYGSYNNIDKVKNLKLNNYIIENEDGYYRVYVGISKNIENASKIREIYNKLGKGTYIRNIVVDSIDFIDYLNSIEFNLMDKSDDEILKIETDIINKYKELK